jgi:hypothetical protein
VLRGRDETPMATKRTDIVSLPHRRKRSVYRDRLPRFAVDAIAPSGAAGEHLTIEGRVTDGTVSRSAM